MELFVCMGVAVYVLFATRELGIGPAVLGGIAAASGPAALVGALGTAIGLRDVLALAAAGLLGVALWLRHSPLGAMRELPAPSV